MYLFGLIKGDVSWIDDDWQAPDYITMSGFVDGVNRTFTLSITPIQVLLLFKNQIMQYQNTNYTLVGNVVTFATAPLSTDLLEAIGL
jgi:hypothetical protein